MNDSDVTLCYNTSLSYLRNKYQDNKIFSKYNVSHEEIAVDVTASLFSENTHGKIEINIPKSIKNEDNNNESEFLFLIITIIKERVDEAIKFEMLKYDLIRIEEYNSTKVQS